MTDEFKNYFSAQSSSYSVYRPHYPPELINWLVAQSRAQDLAFDVATGSGQTAHMLADRFARVIASDASKAQIDNAVPCKGVEYRVERAEQSGLADGSVDLLTVAQAAHWFDMEAFNKEAARILKPEGFIAIWCYGLMEITPQIDQLVWTLYEDILGDDYWAPERKIVESGYKTLPFPFPEVTPPSFKMVQNWSLEHLLGYLGTWSAVQNYKQEKGIDPVSLVSSELRQVWNSGEAVKLVHWPVGMRAGRWS